MLTQTVKAYMNTLIEANVNCLEQGICLLESLSDEIYSSKCREVFGSSIGEHFRHNIDHYLAFREGFARGRIDYDARERNISLQDNSSEARHLMADLVSFLRAIEQEDLEKQLEIRMDDGGDSTWSRTSLRRELQFLLSHTIHHYALIVSIANRREPTCFPDGFGVAPSTLHYREATGA